MVVECSADRSSTLEESPHVPTIKVGWRYKSAPWLIVHVASGLCIACVTSENVARAKVEDAYNGDGELRQQVAVQISEFIAEERGKLVAS
jgi:hypothetical protein